VVLTAATLTSHPFMACPSGIFMSNPCSLALRSTTSSSENRIRSSYPDAVGIPETIISSTSFSHFFASFFRFVSSSRSSEDEMFLFAKDSRNCWLVNQTPQPCSNGILGAVPLATYPARSPSLVHGRGKENCGHGERKCIVKGVGPNRPGRLLQTPI
jgi:hypothetical protein